MAGKKTTIWELGLKVDDAVTGLKKIKGEANSLLNLLKNGITVKIDPKQFANLTYAIRGLGRDMAGSTKQIATAVSDINKKLKTITPVAQKVGEQVSDAFANSMAEGGQRGAKALDASMTRMEASAEAHMKRMQARFNKLPKEAQDRLQKSFVTEGSPNRGMSVTNPDYFISKDKITDKEFIDPNRVEALKQALVAEEQITRNVQQREVALERFNKNREKSAQRLREMASGMYDDIAKQERRVAEAKTKTEQAAAARNAKWRKGQEEMYRGMFVQADKRDKKAEEATERRSKKEADAAQKEENRLRKQFAIIQQRENREKAAEEARLAAQRESLTRMYTLQMIAIDKKEAKDKAALARKEREELAAAKRVADAWRKGLITSKQRSEIETMALQGKAKRSGIDPKSIGLIPNPAQFIKPIGNEFDTKKLAQIKENLRNAEHHARKLSQELKASDREAKKLMKSTGGIGQDLTRSIALMAKWLIFFRLIRDVTMVIEKAITGFVRAGVEYAEVSELQRLALAASLNEHMKVYAIQENGQRRLVQGAAGLNLLQAESVKQWEALQRSSLQVVGGTQDLMDIYVTMLPMASRLGATSEEMQKMVRGTAIAASLLKIEFQDARTGLAMLLQGRARVSNRFIASLGLTPADVKDQATRFKTVQKALQSYVDIGDKAQGTFGAMKESFKEMIGIIGENVTVPFMDTFKKMVDGLQKQIFTTTEEGIKPKEETKLFFAIVRASMRAVSAEVEDFGRTLAKDGRQNLLTYVTTLRNAISGVKEFAIGLGKALIWIANFISANQLLIKHLAMLALAFAGLQRVTQFGKALTTMAGATSLLSRGIEALAARFPGLSRMLVKTTTEAGVTKTAITGLSAGVAGFAAGIVTGGILIGIGLLISKLYQLAESARKAKESLVFALNGDIFGGIAADQENFESKDPVTRAMSQRRHLGTGVGRAENQMDAAMGFRKPEDFWKQQVAKERKNADMLADPKTSEGAIASLLKEKEQLEEVRNKVTKHAEDIVLTKSLIGKMRQTADEMYNSISEGDRKIITDPQFGKIVNLASKSERDRLNQMRADLSSADQLRADADRADRAVKKAEDSNIQKQKADRLILDPKPQPDAVVDKTNKAFEEHVDHRLRQNLEYLDAVQATTQAYRDNDLMSQEQYILAMNKIDDSRYETTMARLKERGVEIDNFEKELREKGEDPKDIKEKVGTLRDGNNDRIASAEIQRERDLTIRGLNEEGRKKQLELLKETTQTDADGILAEIFGRSEEAVEKKIEKIIQKVQKDFKDLGNPAGAKPVVDKLTAAIPAAKQLETAEKAMASYGRQVDDVRAHQAALDRQFENSQISVSDYVEATQRNSKLEIEALEAKKRATQDALNIAVVQDSDPAKIAELNAEIRNLTEQIKTLKDIGAQAVATFNQLQNALAAIAEYSSVFDPFSTKISSVVGALQAAIGAGNKFGQMLNSINKGMAAMQLMGSKGGAKDFFSQFSGGLGMKDGKSTGISAALGGIGFGVSAAISIAGALFQRAVEKAKKTITKSIEEISKALGNGTITIGDAEAELRRRRDQMIRRYSGSKSGRDALKEMLPQIDDEIAALKNKIKDIRKTFEEKLRDTKLGSGPFADFTKMLLDLEKSTREYLDTFKKGSKEYLEALKTVTEMFNVTLRQAKAAFQAQMLGFEAEAINSAIAVFDLLEEKESLYQSLIDLADRQAQLDEDAAEAQDEMREDIEDLAKKREENAQRILDLEREIADVIREAAQSELEIRQRGVLEAQESIGMQKAREISGVRYDAQKEIDDLRKQIAELKRDNAEDEKRDQVKNHEKRMRALEKERAAIDRQILQTHDNIRLNGIRTNTAMQIADIEGSMFDISGDRFELEERRGMIEIAQAHEKIKQWQEIQALIDAIVDNGEGVIFNAPPGFPQIRVTIGDIVINQQVQPTPTPTPGYRGDVRDPRRPGDEKPGGGGTRSSYDASSDITTIGETGRVRGF